MANESPGHRLRLSANRALVVDGCHYARQIPFFPVERVCDLREVDRLRKAAARRISWTAVFLKAYGLVAQQYAPLRRAYLRWPWPHVYEHAHSVAMLAMNREHHGEDRLCWGRFIKPDRTPLADLQRALDAYQDDPVEVAFKRQVRLSRLPLLLRRLVWWVNLNLQPSKRAKRLGTFSMSSLAGQGALNRFHFTVLSTSITYGPLDEAGRAPVTLICDHRVIDGALAARALIDLECVLQTEIARELETLGAKPLAA